MSIIWRRLLLFILVLSSIVTSFYVGYGFAIKDAKTAPTSWEITRNELTLPEPSRDSVIETLAKYALHTRFVNGRTLCERMAKSFAEMVNFTEFAIDPNRNDGRFLDRDGLRDGLFNSAHYIMENCSELSMNPNYKIRGSYEEARKIDFLSLFRYR